MANDGRTLVWVQEPTRVRMPATISPPPVVEVRLGGAPDPRIIDCEVRLRILQGPPGAALRGNVERGPGGVAVFPNLRATVPGAYVLEPVVPKGSLEIAGLAQHSAHMFFDIANGVDEDLRLICERTGYVLEPQDDRWFNLPALIDSPLGANTARRFTRSESNVWEGLEGTRTIGLGDWIASGCIVHSLYRQHMDAPRYLPGWIIGVPIEGSGLNVLDVKAGFNVNAQGDPPQQEIVYGRRRTYRGYDLTGWSLLSVGGSDGEIRVYVNGVQSGVAISDPLAADGRWIQVGNELNGDIAQIGIEPVSSLGDMDAKALHAAQMCRVAP